MTRKRHFQAESDYTSSAFITRTGVLTLLIAESAQFFFTLSNVRFILPSMPDTPRV